MSRAVSTFSSTLDMLSMKEDVNEEHPNFLTIVPHDEDRRNQFIDLLRSNYAELSQRPAKLFKRNKKVVDGESKYKENIEEKKEYVVKSFLGHTEGVLSVIFDQSHLVTGSCDKTIKVFNVNTTECVATLKGHQGWVNCVTLTDKKILSGGYDHAVKMWDIEGKRKIRSFMGHNGSVTVVKAKDELVLSGSYDAQVRLWDIRVKKSQLPIFKGHQSPISCLEFYGNNECISASRDGTIRIWELRSGREIQKLSEHVDWIKCVKTYTQSEKKKSILHIF